MFLTCAVVVIIPATAFSKRAISVWPSNPTRFPCSHYFCYQVYRCGKLLSTGTCVRSDDRVHASLLNTPSNILLS
jgi:hypothetical protein